jgi:hypothetical protein
MKNNSLAMTEFNPYFNHFLYGSKMLYKQPQIRVVYSKVRKLLPISLLHITTLITTRLQEISGSHHRFTRAWVLFQP